MKMYKLYDLHPKELAGIHTSLGGKYDFRERLSRGGTGSPRLYYLDGHPAIDALKNRTMDELRINFEEFKNGLMLGITDHTNPYILPLRPEEVQRISVVLIGEKVQLHTGSFFYWLLRMGLPMTIARIFARPGEHEESRTDFVLQTAEFSIHGWATHREFNALKSFFEKSCLRHLLEATPSQANAKNDR